MEDVDAQDQSEVRYGDVVAVDRVVYLCGAGRGEVRNDW